jgi:predicted GH43/DUF377 family glycosyl hydrolase
MKSCLAARRARISSCRIQIKRVGVVTVVYCAVWIYAWFLCSSGDLSHDDAFRQKGVQRICDRQRSSLKRRSHIGGGGEPRISVALYSHTFFCDESPSSCSNTMSAEIATALLSRPDVDFVLMTGPGRNMSTSGCHVDIYVIVGYHARLERSLDLIRGMQPTAVVVFINSGVDTRFIGSNLEFDVVLLNSRVLAAVYRRQTGKVVGYLPPAGKPFLRPCQPNLHWTFNVVYISDFSQDLAHLYPSFLDEAAPYGLRIYGDRWSNTRWANFNRGNLGANDLQSVLCNSKVILALSTERHLLYGIVDSSLYDIMLVGGGVVISNNENIPGSVLVSRGSGDTSRLIHHALREERWRSNFAHRAQLKIALDQTWAHRVEVLLHSARRHRPSIPVKKWYPSWHSRSADFSIEFDNVSSIVTNPSVAVYGATAVFAARTLSFKYSRRGRGIWSSSILLSAVDSHSLLSFRHNYDHVYRLQVHAVLSRASRARHECDMPLGSDEATGPEDPRVFVLKEEFYVMFSSRALHSGAAHACSTDAQTRQSMVKLKVFHEVDRRTDIKIGVVREFSMSAQDMSQHEKNWMPFVHSDQLLFVQYIKPYVVLSLSRSELSSGKDNVFLPRYSISTDSDAIPTWNISFGGGTPLILSKMPSYLASSGDVCYVGVFHVQISHRCYENFAFIASAIPPFRIRRLSRALPLLRLPRGFKSPKSSSIAFVTGLSIWQDRVIMSYGSGDTTARVSALSLTDFFKYFT